jgi:hypothetical protein
MPPSGAPTAAPLTDASRYTLPTLPSNSGRGALLLANPARAALSGFSSLDGNRLDSC